LSCRERRGGAHAGPMRSGTAARGALAALRRPSSRTQSAGRHTRSERVFVRAPSPHPLSLFSRSSSDVAAPSRAAADASSSARAAAAATTSAASSPAANWERSSRARSVYSWRESIECGARREARRKKGARVECGARLRKCGDPDLFLLFLHCRRRRARSQPSRPAHQPRQPQRHPSMHRQVCRRRTEAPNHRFHSRIQRP